jgi:hypothetical protein
MQVLKSINAGLPDKLVSMPPDPNHRPADPTQPHAYATPKTR